MVIKWAILNNIGELNIRIETVVKDEVVDQMIKEITTKLSSGNVGDGKVFVYPVEQAVRIRTGETGENAL